MTNNWLTNRDSMHNQSCEYVQQAAVLSCCFAQLDRRSAAHRLSTQGKQQNPPPQTTATQQPFNVLLVTSTKGTKQHHDRALSHVADAHPRACTHPTALPTPAASD